MEPVDKTRSDDKVSEYYDAVAEGYFQQYRRESLQSAQKYPQNYYRLQIIVQRMAATGAKSVYEVGVGEGTPLATLARMGFAVAGCDISQNMVDATRRKFGETGVDPNRVQWGDIEDSLTISNQLAMGPFDALIALGVMPHLASDHVGLGNMRMLLKPGGRAFIEFRNKLFSLFTFNRYTKQFILDDLLAGVATQLKDEVAKELDQRLALDQPPLRKDPVTGASYDEIRAKFHNPFEVVPLLERAGFSDARIHWYHFHAAPPMLEPRLRAQYREEASKLEHDASWRGYFLCSAFVVEAVAA
jgi:2-polyprenyl-3-methyl-5-hydroxy-6-metoxy-1,4-benzoquinol methylase